MADDTPARQLLLNFADHIVRQGRVVWSPDARVAIVDEYLEQAGRAEQRGDCIFCGQEIRYVNGEWAHVAGTDNHFAVSD